MKKIVILVSLVMSCLHVFAGPAMAADYTADGRVIMGTDKQLTSQDLLAAGGIGGLTTVLSLTTATAAPALAPVFANVAVMIYGSYRTAKYRPESVKVSVREAIKANNAKPVPGSIAELLS